MVDPNEMSSSGSEDEGNCSPYEDDDSCRSAKLQKLHNGKTLRKSEYDGSDGDDEEVGGATGELNVDNFDVPEEDPDDEQDEDQSVASPGDKKSNSSTIMGHFGVHQKAGPKITKLSSEPKAVQKLSTRNTKKVHLRDGNGKATKASTEISNTNLRGAPESPTNDSDDEYDDLQSKLPENKGVAMVHDAEQEFDDQRVEATKSQVDDGEGAVRSPFTDVHESALKVCWIMKNEKVNKWFHLNSKALVYAPEMGQTFSMSVEELTISSKRERLVMQEALVDKNVAKIIETVMIGKLQADSTGSGSGPGITNLVAAIPVELNTSGAELEDLKSKIKCKDKLVTLLALDHEIVKRIYKVQSGTLPMDFSPITNSGNKFKVPVKMEDWVKSDNNFTMIGTADKNKRVQKKSAEDSSGKVNTSSRKASSGSGPSPSFQEDVADSDKLSPCLEGSGFWTPISSNVAFGEVECKDSEVITVLRCGGGKCILTKSMR